MANTEKKVVLINFLMVAFIRIVAVGVIGVVDSINDSPVKPLNAIKSHLVMIGAIYRGGLLIHIIKVLFLSSKFVN